MSDLPCATISEQDGIRYLHLGATPWVQGAFAVRAPRVIVLAYVQRMLAALLWREATPPHHAVQLGLGAATLTRFCHGALRAGRVTAVEINPAVIAACRHGFRLPEDDVRLAVVEADASAWIAGQRANVDLLHVDLYDHEAAAPVCDSAGFYADCRASLAPGGVMAVNLFGRRASFADSSARIASAFGRDQVWTLRPTREGNTIVVAAAGVTVPDRATLTARAATIERRFGLPAHQWLRLVRPL